MKGPIDYDKQCGVINDKNLPCSRSLTCKSHSMGAKRAVVGRSRPYDELYNEWQRLNNPNWVEPTKKETKAEKKAQREREKAEKKRLQAEAAAAAAASGEGSAGGVGGAAAGGQPGNSTPAKKSGAGAGASKKQSKKAAAAALAAVRLADSLAEHVEEDLDYLDSEAEMDELEESIRVAQQKGLVAVPLAVPCDAGSWFVQRRERTRCCRDLFMAALGGNGLSGMSGMGMGGMGVNMPMTMAMAMPSYSAGMGPMSPAVPMGFGSRTASGGSMRM